MYTRSIHKVELIYKIAHEIKSPFERISKQVWDDLMGEKIRLTCIESFLSKKSSVEAHFAALLFQTTITNFKSHSPVWRITCGSINSVLTESRNWREASGSYVAFRVQEFVTSITILIGIERDI